MNVYRIVSSQPRCKTCKKLMESWNPFAEVHEHIDCAVDRISTKLVDVLKIELNKTAPTT